MPSACDHLKFLAGKDDDSELQKKIENYSLNFKDNFFIGASSFDKRGYSHTTNTVCDQAF